jgi:hypothetical protein
MIFVYTPRIDTMDGYMYLAEHTWSALPPPSMKLGVTEQGPRSFQKCEKWAAPVELTLFFTILKRYKEQSKYRIIFLASTFEHCTSSRVVKHQLSRSMTGVSVWTSSATAPYARHTSATSSTSSAIFAWGYA